MNFHLRPPTHVDVNYIRTNWLKSHRISDECKRIRGEVYFKRYDDLIFKIMNHSLTLIACNPDDHDQIYGFICYKKMDDICVIHYVYIKYLFRQRGLFKRMVSSVTDTQSPIICTFANRFFDKIRGKLILSYDPFLRY